MSKRADTLLLGRFVPVNKPSVPSIACWSKASLASPPLSAKRSEASRPAKRAASVRRYENDAWSLSGLKLVATNVSVRLSGLGRIGERPFDVWNSGAQDRVSNRRRYGHGRPLDAQESAVAAEAKTGVITGACGVADDAGTVAAARSSTRAVDPQHFKRNLMAADSEVLLKLCGFAACLPLLKRRRSRCRPRSPAEVSCASSRVSASPSTRVSFAGRASAANGGAVPRFLRADFGRSAFPFRFALRRFASRCRAKAHLILCAAPRSSLRVTFVCARHARFPPLLVFRPARLWRDPGRSERMGKTRTDLAARPLGRILSRSNPTIA